MYQVVYDRALSYTHGYSKQYSGYSIIAYWYVRTYRIASCATAAGGYVRSTYTLDRPPHQPLPSVTPDIQVVEQADIYVYTRIVITRFDAFHCQSLRACIMASL